MSKYFFYKSGPICAILFDHLLRSISVWGLNISTRGHVVGRLGWCKRCFKDCLQESKMLFGWWISQTLRKSQLCGTENNSKFSLPLDKFMRGRKGEVFFQCLLFVKTAGQIDTKLQSPSEIAMTIATNRITSGICIRSRKFWNAEIKTKW